MRALLLVNPFATATTPAAREVLAHAVASEVKLEVVHTEYRGHAEEVARQATLDGVSLIVAHGGDGTVNEVVNGVRSVSTSAVSDADTSRTSALTGTTSSPTGTSNAAVSAPMLGVVPGGSANVFARALGLPRDPVEATHRLLRAVADGSSRTVGLGRANERWFTFNAGLGWDAEVVAGVDRARSRQRRVTPGLYARIALTRYCALAREEPKITVQVADEEPVTDVHQIFLANTDPWTYFGSRPVRLIPECAFDSGLGMFALRTMHVQSVLRYVAQALRPRGTPHGKHLIRAANLPAVHVACTEPLRLQVDGDELGERTEVEFVSEPAALRVAV